MARIEYGTFLRSRSTSARGSLGGGALPRLLGIFRKGLGGRIGKGRQWISWIHIDDAVGAYLHALDTPSLAGPVNLAAPENARNADFAQALGRALHRPAALPVPATALRLVLGQLSEYVLKGRRAVPRALLDSGYRFAYPSLDAALADLVSR